MARSKVELEGILDRYGATETMLGKGPGRAVIAFVYDGSPYQLTIDIHDDERLNRQGWRVLILLLKAQLEAIEAEIVSAEEVFMPYRLLIDGTTFAQHALPKLLKAQQAGRMPVALLGLDKRAGAGEQD